MTRAAHVVLARSSCGSWPSLSHVARLSSLSSQKPGKGRKLWTAPLKLYTTRPSAKEEEKKELLKAQGKKRERRKKKERKKEKRRENREEGKADTGRWSRKEKEGRR